MTISEINQSVLERAAALDISNMEKEERFREAYNCLLCIKQGDIGKKEYDKLIERLWLLLYPVTEHISRRFYPKDGSTNHYAIEDIINESYFAFLEALNREKLTNGTIKDLYEFFGLYKLVVRSRTTKLRLTYRRHDPIKYSISFDNTFGSSESQKEKPREISLADMIPDENAKKRFEEIIERGYLNELRTALNYLNRYLTEDELYVIRAKYYQNKSCDQICKELGYLKDRIRNLEIRALYKYRSHAKEVDLISFL